MVVMPLKPKLGVQRAVAEVVNDAFVAALQARGAQVITQKDVDSMLGLEQRKAALNVEVARRMGEDGCAADTACLAEIGGALGATLLVTGSLSKLGGSLQFTAELLDQRKGQVIRRFHKAAPKSGDDAYLALAEEAAEALLPGAGPPPQVKSEVTFGSGVQVAVPTVQLRGEAQADFGTLNLEVEKLLEAAQDAEESRAQPEQIQAAWCRLAEVKKANPYAKKAKEACDGWARYLAATKGLERDFEVLKGYLALKRKSPEQKNAVVAAFLATYGGMSQHPLVREAMGMRARLGVAVELPTAGDDVVEAKSGLRFVRLRGGVFDLGCASADRRCDSDERQTRNHEVGPFALSRTEVTVAAFARCVDAGACSAAPQRRTGSEGA
ncbi:MAG: SUMF1/EgtB/PvdO family nonheme iron enzyme, partial [Myxococcales bacterium]